jgi:hypothetical protein
LPFSRKLPLCARARQEKRMRARLRLTAERIISCWLRAIHTLADTHARVDDKGRDLPEEETR